MAGTTKISQFFEGTWRIIILVSAVMVWVSSSVAVWSVLPGFAAAFAMVTPIGVVIKRQAGLWTACLVCLGAFVAINRFLAVEDVADVASAMIALLVGFLPVTITFRERQTSYWLSVLNVTIINLGCIIIANELVIYALLVTFIIVVTLNLNAAFLLFSSPIERQAAEPLPKRYFSQFIFALPIGALATALIFFAFPRVNSLALDFDFGEGRARTGYTGVISLAQGRQIDESDALALLVDHEDKDWLRKNAGAMLLRGNSLKNFDGANWRREPLDGNAPYQVETDFRLHFAHRERPRELTFYREPTSARALFYPGVVVSIPPPRRPSPGIVTDREGNFFRSVGGFDRFAYRFMVAELALEKVPSVPLSQVVANLAVLPDRRTEPHQLARTSLDEYLQLPASIREAPYFQEFVRAVEAGGPIESTDDLRVALSLFFQRNFEASLVNDFSSADTLAEFLSSDRRGHCEYFATAAVLLFRSLGLPARIVLGYRGGVFNSVSQLVEVRELNAHAWVETYLPGHGWLPYDPTPLSPPAPSGGIEALLQYMNAASFWFNKYVVDYNRDTQKGLLTSLATVRQRDTQTLRLGDLTPLWRGIAFGLGGAVLLTILLIAVRLWSSRVGGHGLPTYYQRFERRLATKGFQRNDGETYRAFHQRLIGQGVEPDLVGLVDQCLEADLYGIDKALEDDLRLVTARLKSSPR